MSCAELTLDKVLVAYYAICSAWFIGVILIGLYLGIRKAFYGDPVGVGRYIQALALCIPYFNLVVGFGLLGHWVYRKTIQKPFPTHIPEH